jgi:hypothetical protein
MDARTNQKFEEWTHDLDAIKFDGMRRQLDPRMRAAGGTCATARAAQRIASAAEELAAPVRPPGGVHRPSNRGAATGAADGLNPGLRGLLEELDPEPAASPVRYAGEARYYSSSSRGSEGSLSPPPALPTDLALKFGQQARAEDPAALTPTSHAGSAVSSVGGRRVLSGEEEESRSVSLSPTSRVTANVVKLAGMITSATPAVLAANDAHVSQVGEPLQIGGLPPLHALYRLCSSGLV